tara:strand:+ start:192 stop:959 length:768 start_codon:yes stop_codon:yes gene_type:complete
MKVIMSKLFQELVTLDHDTLQIMLLQQKTIEITKNYIAEAKLENINLKILLASLLLNNDHKLCDQEDLNQLSNQIVKSIIGQIKCNDIIKKFHDKFLQWQEEDKEKNRLIIEKVTKQVEEIMKKAFWDKIHDDLSNKKTESVMIVVEDLKEKTKGLCLVPGMKDQIDRQFDTEIIKQIIDNDRMNENDFEMFFYPLYQTIRLLQAPVYDSILDRAYMKIKSQVDQEDWKIAFISSLKVLTEAVAEIYIDLIRLSS